MSPLVLEEIALGSSITLVNYGDPKLSVRIRVFIKKRNGDHFSDICWPEDLDRCLEKLIEGSRLWSSDAHVPR